MSHLILIGLRGSGKTTVGRGLAPRLGLPHIDLDESIVARTAMSIPKLVYEHGWEYFRDQETHALVEATSGPPAVLSTGGGAILRPYNRDVLKQSG
ncbi:MAG: shikimate kinase, partial [Chlamydiia bacterium]